MRPARRKLPGILSTIRSAARAHSNTADVIRPELGQLVTRQRRSGLGKGQGDTVGAPEVDRRIFEIAELSCTEDLWMACQDLLHQGAARARHAEEEHRYRRRIANTFLVTHDLQGVRA